MQQPPIVSLLLDEREIDLIPSVPELARIFLEEIGGNNHVSIRIPLPSIGSSNSYLDIISDYADASFIAESIGALCQERKLEPVFKDYKKYLQLTVSGFDPVQLAEGLALAAVAAGAVEELTSDSVYYSLRESINEHEADLCDKPLIFPEIADDYFVNLVHGAYYELELEVFEHQLIKFPERKYGFFASRVIDDPDGKVLLSPHTWIVPHAIGVERAFREIGNGLGALMPADTLTVNGDSYLVCEDAVYRFHLPHLIQAIACADAVSRCGDPCFSIALDINSWLLSSTGHRRNGYHAETENECMRAEGRLSRTGNTHQPWAAVSDFGEYAVITLMGSSIVLYKLEQLDEGGIADLMSGVNRISISLLDGVRSSSEISLPWADIDDEIFEQICYDIIYHNPRFDRDRIEKMGKSRSRDGGRDIVAWTKPRYATSEEPKKYIFQCKHISDGTSLTARNYRESIGDVLDQFDADGYGVMCCGFIDATLHDRIDAISRNRGLEHPYKYDLFLMERFLARRPHLIERHFGLNRVT